LNGSAPCSICTPAQLISRPLRATDSAAREPCPAAESSDVEVVEAALGALAPVLTAPISTARLAQALGWPRARIAAALGGLEDWFHGTGTRLDRDRDDRGGQLRVLRPRHTPLSTEQRAALHQLPAALPPLTAPAARALYNIVCCGATVERVLAHFG